MVSSVMCTQLSMDFHEFGKGVSAYVQLIVFWDDHKTSDSAPILIFAAMSRAGTAEIFKRYWHRFLHSSESP